MLPGISPQHMHDNTQGPQTVEEQNTFSSDFPLQVGNETLGYMDVHKRIKTTSGEIVTFVIINHQSLPKPTLTCK